MASSSDSNSIEDTSFISAALATPSSEFNIEDTSFISTALATPSSTPEEESKLSSKDNVRLSDIPVACGFCTLATARGAVVMSNIFLSTALIYLASEQVGCIIPNRNTGELQVDDDCDQRVYGVFRPAALITNIAVISGVLSALFMPIAGAIIDFTPHRWTVGVTASALIVLVQMIQIFVSSHNWFVMAILQAFWGCFYQVLTLASYAYLPIISRQVNEKTMAQFTSLFTMAQFGTQAVFLLIIVGISLGMDLNDVETARVSQTISCISITIPFAIGWSRLPKVEPLNVLQDDTSVLWQGFRQNWKTAKAIHQNYKRSLRWFLLGAAFSEPAASGFTVASVVLLKEQLQMSSSQIGVMFFVILIAFIPGGILATKVSHCTDANTSVRLFCFNMFLLSVFGALVLTPNNVNPVAYIWGFFLGLTLGAYYPSLKLFLSLIVPKSKEAEMVGFFIYSYQILAWLPPLIFSSLVEAGVDVGLGLMSLGCFFLIAINLFSMAAPFDELLEEVRLNEVKDKAARQDDTTKKLTSDSTTEAEGELT